MPNLGPTELIIIAVILVLLFGARKLPDTARAIGRSMRIFKSETAKLRDDDDTTVQQVAQPAATPQPAAPAPQQLAPAQPALSPEEQAKVLEEQAARLRAQASAQAGAQAGAQQDKH
ncbi:sec-independent protein translocase protein TatA [Thermocatellispora tengchongensis]|uniref:Sec-independent protein translocase protein TatA n=1 Tax=Thermocatellispora tengchongensis TaxID=1073253 RepID=A0A840P922_9ACTN|nr:Sec-independent protein translocase subunit TatA [Thermocatellispora tengchongensis]MBB5135792.1 sec-independent protein translocase protein TatA [Thermocatellispora tengchongensis]